MKRNLTKVLGASVIALSAATLPVTLPAQAQVNEPTVTTTTAPNATYETRTYENRGFDWGWLGLLGLIGLAGLAGKKRNEESTRYRDPNTAGTTTYRE
ncbi:MAG: WGxxGxxG-CTERM domain-containing protein [Cyanomargarita calcarea GSE-NOS-MK-12-04C]|jgi:hypothetical protein|uniref:WGxxGxxG-CTERM domain-containing protein n=1 Tax=Cyanomargarita calcarea GSE-NOS-MK-12-04C TaxID=2839659 RepID=A0A951UYD0_9CYAN|nr:WGxxGxxG-CTERM domain-containing protein [Cyanomargarita calcarea GSE-NOS-MK-12-04C]